MAVKAMPLCDRVQLRCRQIPGDKQDALRFLICARPRRGYAEGMSWPTGINLERLEPETRAGDSGGANAEAVAAAQLETEIIVESLSNGWSAQAGNTAHVMARLGDHVGFEPPTGDPATPYGRYLGRPIIGRDSRIDGGVYIGRKPREAIVVDMVRGGLLDSVYRNWLRELEGHAPMWPWQHLTAGRKRAVQRYVQHHIGTLSRALVNRLLPFDRHVVAQVASEHTLGPDDKVRLDVYLRRRGGVCRHQVCLLGALLERLVLEGWAEGRVSIDRKFVPRQYSHAWVRWTDGEGRVWILDAAQDVWGLLETFEPERRWFYAREDE